MRGVLLIVAASFAVLAGAAIAHAHHEGTAPERVPVIERVYPDLAERRADEGRSWAWLRRAAAARWGNQHPAAARRHERLKVAAAVTALADRYRDEFTCIGGHEATAPEGGILWTANTGNGYYGGLQMDVDFYTAYGRELDRRTGSRVVAKGGAHNWTAEEQIAAATIATERRGFTPWPNTARYCGLL